MAKGQKMSCVTSSVTCITSLALREPKTCIFAFCTSTFWGCLMHDWNDRSTDPGLFFFFFYKKSEALMPMVTRQNVCCEKGFIEPDIKILALLLFSGKPSCEILHVYWRNFSPLCQLLTRWPFPDLWPCLQFATQSRLVCSDVLCMTFTLACSHYTVAFRWGLFVIWNLIYTKEILTGKQNTSNTLHLIMWDFVNYTCRLFVFETCMIHFKGL